MFLLGIVLYALERFHSPTLAGWMTFATIAPGLAISPIAGAWLDRMGPPRGIMVDMAASAGLLLLLAVGDWCNFLSLPLIFFVVTLFSFTTPLGSVGLRALLPRLVPPHSLDRANALDTTSYAVIDILGPAIAGVLFGFAGPTIALFTISALYALAGLSLAPLVRLPPAGRIAGSSKVLHEAVAGIVHVLRNASLRGLACAYALYQASLGILFVAVPVYVAQSGRAEGYIVGALWALTGLAGGVGALCVGKIPTSGREVQVIIFGLLATAMAIYPVAMTFGLVGLAMGLAGVGFFSGPVDVGVLSLRQRRTDPGWLGRVLAVSMSLNMSGLPLGSALGGFLVAQSPHLAFAAAAGLSLLGALAALTLIPRRS
ncbi:MFS transporter [soil metagenome]